MSAEKSIGVSLTKTKSGSEVADLVISGLFSIGRIGVTSEEKDVTTLDSEGGFAEVMLMKKDAGEVPLAGYIKDESVLEALQALADSQALEEYTVETPNGATWVFDAFVKMAEEAENTVDGVRAFNATLRISGKPVFTKAVVSA